MRAARLLVIALVVGTSILASTRARADDVADKGQVRIRIWSPAEVVLVRPPRPPSETAWVDACRSPCNLDLPIGERYQVRIANSGRSQALDLSARPGDTLDIEVSPPSKTGLIIGGTIAGAGALALVAGGLTALWGQVLATHGSSDNTRAEGEDLRSGGLISLAIGAGAAVLGGIIALVSSQMTISQHVVTNTVR